MRAAGGARCRCSRRRCRRRRARRRACPRRVDLVVNRVAGTDLVRLHEVLHREVHAGQVAAGDRQVARHERAGGDHDGVVARAQVVPGDVDADVHAGAEPGALGLHLGEAASRCFFSILKSGMP